MELTVLPLLRTCANAPLELTPFLYVPEWRSIRCAAHCILMLKPVYGNTFRFAEWRGGHLPH